MNTTYNLPTKFARNTRFAVNAMTTVPFRSNQDTHLEQLKVRLLRQLLNGDVTADLNVRLRRAANEAAALAWLEPYPLLVFPTLLEEKARVATKQVAKQRKVYQRSRRLLDVAVDARPSRRASLKVTPTTARARSCSNLLRRQEQSERGAPSQDSAPRLFRAGPLTRVRGFGFNAGRPCILSRFSRTKRAWRE